MQSLGLVHLELGSPRLAEMTLRAAIRLDPNNHVSWYNLGLVMEVRKSFLLRKELKVFSLCLFCSKVLLLHLSVNEYSKSESIPRTYQGQSLTKPDKVG